MAAAGIRRLREAVDVGKSPATRLSFHQCGNVNDGLRNPLHLATRSRTASGPRQQGTASIIHRGGYPPLVGVGASRSVTRNDRRKNQDWVAAKFALAQAG